MTTHEIIRATETPIGVILEIRWDEAGVTDEQIYCEQAAKALGWKRPDPQPVDPAWIKRVALEVEERGPVDRYNCAVNALHLALSRCHVVLAPVMPSEDFVSEDDPLFTPIWDAIKGWDIGDRAKYGGYCGATGDHVRAIIRAVRSAAPVMPSDEEMLKDAREAAAHVNQDSWPGTAGQIRSGEHDRTYEVKSALQALRNVYASLGGVAGKAVSSGPVVPEVDLREILNKAWRDGFISACGALSNLSNGEGDATTLYSNERAKDVSFLLENLKSGEA